MYVSTEVGMVTLLGLLLYPLPISVSTSHF